MARKRDIKEGLPPSPLAAKLALQVNESSRMVQAVSTLLPQPPPLVVGGTTKTQPEAPKGKSLESSRKPSRTHKRKESRVMLDADEWAMKDEIVGALRRATGRQVEFSHLMRSLLGLASSAIPAIETNAKHASLPSRPANNDLMALAAFEDELGKFLLLAFRDKKAMDAD